MRDAIIDQLKALRSWAAWFGLTTVVDFLDSALADTRILDWLISLIEGFLRRESAGEAFAMDVSALSVADAEFAKANSIDPGTLFQVIQLFLQVWNWWRSREGAAVPQLC